MIRPDSIIDSLIFNAVRIEVDYSDGSAGTGTAFFYHHWTSEQGGPAIPLLVTNKHVIEGATTTRFFLHAAKKEGDNLLPTGCFHPITMTQVQVGWFMHPDDDVDLCAMPTLLFEPTFEKDWGAPVFKQGSDSSIVWSDEEMERLSAVEDVLMFGFPIGLWDEVNNLPLVRRGVTASHPALNYKGHSQVVIDAACYPGSSGSPVYLLNEVSRHRFKEGNDPEKTPVILLGVLSSGPTYNVEGEIVVKDIPTRLHSVSRSAHMINLGYVEKARELEVLGKFVTQELRKMGKL